MIWYLAAVLFALVVYYWVIKPLNYWKSRGIPYLPAYPFVGNFLWSTLGLRSFADEVLVQYNAMPEKKCFGVQMFNIPTLTVRDLDLIRSITIKDFDHFTDHVDALFKEDSEPLFGKNLFALKGKRWRNMRATLSPAFTGSKMRGMFAFMSECGDQFTAHYMKEYEKQNDGKPIEVDFKSLFTRFTNDVIATTAFGIKCDSFNDPENIFFRMGQKSTNFEQWRFIFITSFPTITKLLKIQLLPQVIYDFFTQLVKETLDTREREHIIRPDMIHLLMEARKGALKHEEGTQEKDTGFAVVQESNIGRSNEKIILSDLDITAQAFIFFFAGFETASVLMCFAAYEMTIQPEIQKRLQDEIDEFLSETNGKITYESVQKMKYLDMVVSETLRKWPPVPTLDRRCTKAFTLKTGDQDIHLEPGMNVNFPIYGIQRDPQYYPNPTQFDPERFSDANKANNAPFFTFGVGPRNCIGSRFALLEAKVALVYLLHTFDLVVTKKTPIPLKLKARSSSMIAEGGFWMGLSPRKRA